MSFLFGARPPRGDKELAEANERTRRAFARDINDQRALAFDPAPRRRKSGLWMVWVVIIFLVAGAAGVLPRFGGVRIEVSCTTPGIALSSYGVHPNAIVQWKTTGPDNVDYVLALDSTAVTGPPNGPVAVDRGTALTIRAYRSNKCVGSGDGFTAPGDTGQHFVRLFTYRSGDWTQVAQMPLTVR